MPENPKITVLDGFPLNPGDLSWEPIARLGEFTVFDSTDDASLGERCANASIILTNKVPLRQKDLPYLQNCKLIGVLATGVNVVDVEDMNNAGIAVCNVPNYGPEDVAQHALALIMELARHAALHDASVKKGDWAKKGWCYWLKPPVSLSGLTLGIAGFGSIGQILGKYGSALGMNILAWSRSRKARVDYPFSYVDLGELFARADVLSLNCPLSAETDKMVNAESIAKMKDGAIIINTARGGLVDEADVAKALRDGKLGGFGADVLACEPPEKDAPLIAAPNTLITPHIAWATQKARQNIIDIMAANIRAFVSGEKLNRV